MNLKSLLLFIGFFISVFSYSQVKVMDWDTFEKEVLSKKHEKITVVNFWATWCAPCVQELPHFEEVAREQSDTVELILVSLDRKSQLDSKLIPFIQKKDIQSSVILLDNVDFNYWVPKVDKDWEGEIPATIILNKDVKHFYSGQLSKKQLIQSIQLIKQK